MSRNLALAIYPQQYSSMVPRGQTAEVDNTDGGGEHKPLNGAELLIRTVSEHGIKVCFANPG